MTDFDQKVIALYNDKNQSTYEIAKQLDTYPNKVRRTLIKHGYELKDKSAAQKAALKSGRSSHPTAGKKRTDAEKIAISQSLVNYWDEMSDKEKARRVKRQKVIGKICLQNKKKKCELKVLLRLELPQRKVLKWNDG